MLMSEMHEFRVRSVTNYAAMLIGLVGLAGCLCPMARAVAEAAPQPLLAEGKPVDWWFVFKFNSAKTFAGCGKDVAKRTCPFGGTVQAKPAFGQQFVSASSTADVLAKGKGCVGATDDDPVGATFEQVYNGSFFYVIWNDQFYRDPPVAACKGDSCGGPWGHSKGLLAWNDAGDGFVMQVSTPGWPRSGSKKFGDRHPNKGNTLGCVSSSNNLRASQHFFALKLNKENLLKVLGALQNASVVTDPTKAQIVKNGGPPEVRKLVDALGTKSKSAEIKKEMLSPDIMLISKPSKLEVPPWQMVSAVLDGATERAATWWLKPWIPTTTKAQAIKCWNQAVDKGLVAGVDKKPGPVAIALTGEWDGQEIGLAAPNNHAKIGVSTAGGNHYAIFGDLNQQGVLAPPGCDSSQNGRGGLFFVVNNKKLFDSVTGLIEGETASTRVPK
jgi:Deoxyribonuclease II